MNAGAGDALRDRLGELVRRRRAGELLPAPASAPEAPTSDGVVAPAPKRRRRRVVTEAESPAGVA